MQYIDVYETCIMLQNIYVLYLKFFIDQRTKKKICIVIFTNKILTANAICIIENNKAYY